MIEYCDTIHQYKADWCKNKNYLPFDICIPSLKIIIELDGNQHFKKIGNWKDQQEIQEKDRYKMKCAINNGFSIIRLLQEDVLYNRIDWKQQLFKVLRLYESPVIILFDNDDVYKNHIDYELKSYVITV